MADSSILKSKANELERRQYFQESFQLSRKIQLLFPLHILDAERELEHGLELGFEPGLRTQASFAYY